MVVTAIFDGQKGWERVGDWRRGILIGRFKLRQSQSNLQSLTKVPFRLIPSSEGSSSGTPALCLLAGVVI